MTSAGFKQPTPKGKTKFLFQQEHRLVFHILHVVQFFSLMGNDLCFLFFGGGIVSINILSLYVKIHKHNKTKPCNCVMEVGGIPLNFNSQFLSTLAHFMNIILFHFSYDQ